MGIQNAESLLSIWLRQRPSRVPPRWGLQVNPDPATGPEAALITDGTSHWRIRACDAQGDDTIRVDQRIKLDTKIKGSAKDSSIRPDGHGSRGCRAITII